MKRNFKNWLTGYCDYAGYSEAPRRMHFWSGVSAIAGALRRRVWIDMGYFKWFPNHYIIFVAPPGVVSKSTTVSIAINLLRKVDGVRFGPDVVTWPALVSAFSAASESFQDPLDPGVFYPQCALTLESSELGNLINPQDREMVDLLVNLWDAKTGIFAKATKTSGNDNVENPWINLIGCTTPAWIAGNFPEYVIQGGFTSRCMFVYAEHKEKFIAYPRAISNSDLQEGIRDGLISDLNHIASGLIGGYRLTAAAEEWGTIWYQDHYNNPPELLRQDDRFGGYLARKQTHIHKLAMVLAASQRDELVITRNDMIEAYEQVTELETFMPKVFAKIGRSEDSINAERLIDFIAATPEGCTTIEANVFVYKYFPKANDYSAILQGALASGQVVMGPDAQGRLMLKMGPTRNQPSRSSRIDPRAFGRADLPDDVS